jgi:hypothetical protein
MTYDEIHPVMRTALLAIQNKGIRVPTMNRHLS